MSGPTWKTDQGALRAEDLQACVDALRAGGIVAVPTETVYGLAADAMNPAALARLQGLKGRDAGKPLPVQVANRESLVALVEEVNRAAHRLMLRYCPGPLTLVMKARPGLPAAVLGEGHSVGLRIPDHAVMLSILQAFGGPLAVTSANPTGQPPAITLESIPESLRASLAGLVDDGPCRWRVASTVVDVTCDPPAILREGAIHSEEINLALQVPKF